MGFISIASCRLATTSFAVAFAGIGGGGGGGTGMARLGLWFLMLGISASPIPYSEAELGRIDRLRAMDFSEVGYLPTLFFVFLFGFFNPLPPPSNFILNNKSHPSNPPPQ